MNHQVSSTFHCLLCCIYTVQIVIYGEKECFEAYSCANETIIANTQDLECFGKASCINSPNITSIGFSASSGFQGGCQGLRSCQNAKSYTNLAGDQDIDGFLALSWSQSIDTQSSVFECEGEASCYNVGTIHSDICTCKGFRSCDNVNTIKSSTITTKGVLSLHNSNLYNRNYNSYENATNTILNVTMKGFFAGYNASVYCGNGATCEVHCHDNACENLNYFCDKNEHESTDCNVTCDAKNGVVCPNGWKDGVFINNSMVEQDWLDYNSKNSYSGDNDNYDSNLFRLFVNICNILFGNEEMVANYCFREYTKVTENSDDCGNLTNVNPKYICDDSEICQNNFYNLTSNLNFTGGNNTNTLCCNGYRSCASTSIVVKYDSYSYSYSGTSYDFDYDTKKSIYINGGYGCRFCKMQVNCETDIWCRSHYGCRSSSINQENSTLTITQRSFNKLLCTGAISCHNAAIRYGKYLACLAETSCTNVDVIGVRYIFAAGMWSFQWTSVVSGGKDVDIFILGFEAATGLNLYCQGNDTCNVYCINYDSCYSLSGGGDKFNMHCADEDRCNIIFLNGTNNTIVDNLDFDFTINDNCSTTTNVSNVNSTLNIIPTSIVTGTTTTTTTNEITPNVTTSMIMMYTAPATTEEEIGTENNDPNGVDWRLIMICVIASLGVVCVCLFICASVYFGKWKKKKSDKNKNFDRVRSVTHTNTYASNSGVMSISAPAIVEATSLATTPISDIQSAFATLASVGKENKQNKQDKQNKNIPAVTQAVTNTDKMESGLYNAPGIPNVTGAIAHDQDTSNWTSYGEDKVIAKKSVSKKSSIGGDGRGGSISGSGSSLFGYNNGDDLDDQVEGASHYMESPVMMASTISSPRSPKSATGTSGNTPTPNNNATPHRAKF